MYSNQLFFNKQNSNVRSTDLLESELHRQPSSLYLTNIRNPTGICSGINSYIYVLHNQPTHQT